MAAAAGGIHRRSIVPVINLLRFERKPIFDQLVLEEKLLRTSSENWCIINDGTHSPTIVMGISGRPLELIDGGKVVNDCIPVIRRFSGGGTVLVDKDTLFVTFICNKNAISDLQPYPQPIMSWTGQLYARVLDGVNDFNLRENDYVFGDWKFGGNAQSITKSRWLHHTSLLWDFDANHMAYLKNPARAPKYRQARSHDDFLCAMKTVLPSRSYFIDRMVSALKLHFSVNTVQLEDIDSSLAVDYQHSTKLLSAKELQ